MIEKSILLLPHTRSIQKQLSPATLIDRQYENKIENKVNLKYIWAIPRKRATKHMQFFY